MGAKMNELHSGEGNDYDMYLSNVHEKTNGSRSFSDALDVSPPAHIEQRITQYD